MRATFVQFLADCRSDFVVLRDDWRAFAAFLFLVLLAGLIVSGLLLLS